MIAQVIAIDGPAYVGKSQIAQTLAKALGYTFINTGHMYRALARRALEKQIGASDEEALLRVPFDIWFEEGRTMVSEGGPGQTTEDWTEGLDKVEIVQTASLIAKLPRVRGKLTDRQRGYAENGWIVMELSLIHI